MIDTVKIINIYLYIIIYKVVCVCMYNMCGVIHIKKCVTTCRHNKGRKQITFISMTSVNVCGIIYFYMKIQRTYL